MRAVPSAFAVAATSVLLVRLGTMQWGLSAGVAAGLVYGLIPRTLWMATQGRSYALAAFLVTLAVFFFVRALSGARRRDWAFFSASMAVASAAFLYTLLLVAVFVVVVNVYREPMRTKRLLGAIAVTGGAMALLALAQDIAGGLMVTLPSSQDFESEEVGKWLEKYYKCKADVPTEHRMRVLRLIENITLGTAAVGYLTESMHGAGSPQAQRIMITRLVDMKQKKKVAKELCGIEKGDHIS